MTSSRLSPIFTVAVASLFLTILSFSQPDSATEITTATSEEKYEKTPDDAALNLHRWGAVTLFHGLPSDRVNAITEDSNGALWFGTDNGLVRYDGRRTEVIGSEGDSRGSLPAQRIRALWRDASGGLWIGTEQGAARLWQGKILPLRETHNAVTGFAESPQHEIMLVTEQGQIIRYQNQQTEVKRENEPLSAALQATVIDGAKQPLLAIEGAPLALKSAVFNANTNEWWIGSQRRGALVQKDEQVREAVPPPQRPYFVNAVYAEGQNLWLGAQASANESGLWLHSSDLLFGKLPVVTGTVNAIHSGNGDLWVGTEGQGALLLRNGNVIERLSFESTKGGLRSDRIYSVFRDHEGIVWFGTDRGVCRYDRDSFRTTTLSNNGQSNFVRSLLTTKDGVTYAGTNRGLFRLDAGLELGVWAEVPEINTAAVHSLLETQDGQVYAGTAGGLFVAAAGSARFQLIGSSELGSIRALTEFAGSLYAIVFEREAKQDIAKGIAKLAGNSLTIVLSDAAARQATCLSVAEPEKQLRVGTSDGRRWRLEPTGLRPENGAATGLLRAIVTSQDKLWLGSEAGLFVVEKNEQRPVLPGVEVQSLTLVTEGEDKHPVLFCATRNAGLYKIRPDTEAKIRFDTEQGLPSPKVFAVTQGAAGEIWIGTNRGIVRHQPNLTPPILEPLRMVADRIYTPDYLTTELRFPAYQKSYLFEFAGLGSKTFPSQFQYEYTLAEEKRGALKKTFITSDAQFPLPTIEPGIYQITARAISRDLIYSRPFVFQLWVSPEAVSWTTILLTGLLLIALAAGGYAFYQQRRTAKANQKLATTNDELRETRIRLAHITEAERSRIARDLHDQTLADLRQLLVMTDQLDKPAPSPHAPTPSLMRRKIEEVSNEIRHICEDLSPSVLENIGFVPALEWALTDAVTHLPAEEKFAYEFHCAPDLEDRLQLSPTEQIQLYRIVQEALNNVCRHAQAQKVQLTIGIENEHELMIEVRDDGIGLDATPENPTGHGIGNIRSRANLIGADVKWLPVNRGSHFVVRKPEAVNH